eukprot:9064248-Pyramimonas_sp.AAC.1
MYLRSWLESELGLKSGRRGPCLYSPFGVDSRRRRAVVEKVPKPLITVNADDEAGNKAVGPGRALKQW